MSETATAVNARLAEAEAHGQFRGRWSPRSFTPGPISEAQIASLFEAARWAPSASNRQPWEFLYATDGPERELFNSLLNDGNRRWAPKASMLVFVTARKVADDGRPVRTAQFDAGAAWMSLALQAKSMGLATHAMGGIKLDEVYDKLNISRETHEVICAIAVGKPGATADLPEDLRDREVPNTRKPLSEVARRWGS
jgi:nitroreductase